MCHLHDSRPTDHLLLNRKSSIDITANIHLRLETALQPTIWAPISSGLVNNTISFSGCNNKYSFYDCAMPTGGHHIYSIQFTNASVNRSFANAALKEARTSVTTNHTIMFARTAITTNATRRSERLLDAFRWASFGCGIHFDCNTLRYGLIRPAASDGSFIAQKKVHRRGVENRRWLTNWSHNVISHRTSSAIIISASNFYFFPSHFPIHRLHVWVRER